MRVQVAAEQRAQLVSALDEGPVAGPAQVREILGHLPLDGLTDHLERSRADPLHPLQSTVTRPVGEVERVEVASGDGGLAKGLRLEPRGEIALEPEGDLAQRFDGIHPSILPLDAAGEKGLIGPLRLRQTPGTVNPDGEVPNVVKGRTNR